MEPERPVAPLDLAERRMPHDDFIDYLRAVHRETIARWMIGRTSTAGARSLLAEVEGRLVSVGQEPPMRPDDLADPPSG